MVSTVNRQVLLKSRPEGIPESGHFRTVESVVLTPVGNQVLVRNLYLSVEPAMRGWVSAVKNHAEPVPIDGLMRSFAARTSMSSFATDPAYLGLIA
jgi:NADPH-dependent curcumin reductase